MCQSAHSGTAVCRVVTSGFLVRSWFLLLLVLVFKTRYQNGSVQEAYPIVASMMLNRRLRSRLLAPDRIILLMHIAIAVINHNGKKEEEGALVASAPG